MPNNFLEFWKRSKPDALDQMYEQAPVLMHSIDRDSRLLKVSRFWASKLGYEPEEMIGRKSSEFLTEESRQLAESSVLPDFFDLGHMSNVAYDFVRKDGSTLPVLMSAIAQYDDAGKFVRSLAVMFDNSEASKMEAELIRAQRVDATGKLVAGVAHDFNNLLSVIQGNLEFLLENPDDSDRDALVREAYSASQRGAALTAQLLSYSRKMPLNPLETNLDVSIQAINSMMRRVAPANVKIETVKTAGLWSAKVDRHQLDSAILNILNNALDSMPDTGGLLTIETGNVRVTEDYVTHRQESIRPGRYVMLAITDNGSGMSDEVRQRAVEPFFTTKQIGEGSGLGLSTVFGFMRQSNGTLRLYSEPNSGTSVRLYFPATNAPDPAEQSAEQDFLPDAAVGLEPIILVAEDEDAVRRVLVRQLEATGAIIHEANSGDEAWRTINMGLTPHLLVTDIVMPGSLQGPALVRRLRDVIPDIQVIFVSGYPQEASIHGNGIRPEDVQFVKPVDKDQLLAAAQKMIDIHPRLNPTEQD